MRDRQYRSRFEPPPPRKRPSAEITGWVEKWDVTLPLPEDERLPAAYDDAVVAAFNAQLAGQASPEQQKLVLAWWTWASGTYHSPYRRDPYASANFMGRQFLGQQTVKLMHLRTRKQSNSEQG
jgi:hypothetical protein